MNRDIFWYEDWHYVRLWQTIGNLNKGMLSGVEILCVSGCKFEPVVYSKGGLKCVWQLPSELPPEFSGLVGDLFVNTQKGVLIQQKFRFFKFFPGIESNKDLCSCYN